MIRLLGQVPKRDPSNEDRGNDMTNERYQKIMSDLGMPNSRSLLQALQQVANEVAQEVQATERERCAKLCDETAARHRLRNDGQWPELHTCGEQAAEECADLIREPNTTAEQPAREQEQR